MGTSSRGQSCSLPVVLSFESCNICGIMLCDKTAHFKAAFYCGQLKEQSWKHSREKSGCLIGILICHTCVVDGLPHQKRSLMQTVADLWIFDRNRLFCIDRKSLKSLSSANEKWEQKTKVLAKPMQLHYNCIISQEFQWSSHVVICRLQKLRCCLLCCLCQQIQLLAVIDKCL